MLWSFFQNGINTSLHWHPRRTLHLNQCKIVSKNEWYRDFQLKLNVQRNSEWSHFMVLCWPLLWKKKVSFLFQEDMFFLEQLMCIVCFCCLAWPLFLFMMTLYLCHVEWNVPFAVEYTQSHIYVLIASVHN